MNKYYQLKKVIEHVKETGGRDLNECEFFRESLTNYSKELIDLIVLKETGEGCNDEELEHCIASRLGAAQHLGCLTDLNVNNNYEETFGKRLDLYKVLLVKLSLYTRGERPEIHSDGIVKYYSDREYLIALEGSDEKFVFNLKLKRGANIIMELQKLMKEKLGYEDAAALQVIQHILVGMADHDCFD